MGRGPVAHADRSRASSRGCWHSNSSPASLVVDRRFRRRSRAIWLPPGVRGPAQMDALGARASRSPWSRSRLAAQIKTTRDVSEDQRNSFSPADQRAARGHDRAARDHRPSRARRSPLRGPAQKRSGKARTRDAARLDPPRRGTAELRRVGRRRRLWRDRVSLCRPIGHKPLDQSARDFAAALSASPGRRRRRRFRARTIPAIRTSPMARSRSSGSSSGCRS